jgi:hypothetical protein
MPARNFLMSISTIIVAMYTGIPDEANERLIPNGMKHYSMRMEKSIKTPFLVV